MLENGFWSSQRTFFTAASCLSRSLCPTKEGYRGGGEGQDLQGRVHGPCAPPPLSGTARVMPRSEELNTPDQASKKSWALNRIWLKGFDTISRSAVPAWQHVSEEAVICNTVTSFKEARQVLKRTVSVNADACRQNDVRVVWVGWEVTCGIKPEGRAVTLETDWGCWEGIRCSRYHPEPSGWRFHIRFGPLPSQHCGCSTEHWGCSGTPKRYKVTPMPEGLTSTEKWQVWTNSNGKLKR